MMKEPLESDNIKSAIDKIEHEISKDEENRPLISVAIVGLLLFVTVVSISYGVLYHSESKSLAIERVNNIVLGNEFRDTISSQKNKFLSESYRNKVKYNETLKAYRLVINKQKKEISELKEDRALVIEISKKSIENIKNKAKDIMYEINTTADKSLRAIDNR